MKKISELRINKTVSRPYRDENGNLDYEYLEFNLQYDPEVKDFQLRLFAKIIDFIFCLIIVIILYLLYFLIAKLLGFTPIVYDDLDFYCFAFLFMLILNSMLEYLSGKTLGKLIFRMQVVNENLQKPKLGICFKRNFLSIIYLFTFFRRLATPSGLNYRAHNSICKTYTIFNKDKNYILSLMDDESDLTDE